MHSRTVAETIRPTPAEAVNIPLVSLFSGKLQNFEAIGIVNAINDLMIFHAKDSKFH